MILFVLVILCNEKIELKLDKVNWKVVIFHTSILNIKQIVWIIIRELIKI
jgi:hypothetical protein